MLLARRRLELSLSGEKVRIATVRQGWSLAFNTTKAEPSPSVGGAEQGSDN
ncbi:MAG: hypothetical protein LBR86_01235 [Tannerella sp.]|nr:hypothetical protein [Tannerella sp.]